MFPLRSGKKSSLFTVIDFGSYALKTAVFELKTGDSFPAGTKKTSVKLPLSCPPPRAIMKLREVLFSVARHLEKIPERILISINSRLAPPYLDSWTIRPAKKNIKGAKRELRAYFLNLFEQHKPAGEAFFAYPYGLTINGYDAGPEFLSGSEIKELGFRVIVLKMPPNVGTLLKETKDVLGGMPVEFIPPPAAYAFSVSRALAKKNCLLMDVGGEETSLTMLKEEKIAAVSSFPFGLNHFLRAAARKTGASSAETEINLKRCGEGMLETEAERKLCALLAPESVIWEKELLKTLDAFYHLGPIPQKILLFGEGARFSMIKSVLRKENLLFDFSVSGAAQTEIPDASAFFGKNPGGLLQGPEDAGLASLMFYAINYEPLF